MPKVELAIPVFGTRAEEAAWWDRHRKRVEDDIRRRVRAGRPVTLGQVMEKVKLKRALRPVTIRLAAEDVETARRLASQKGLGYQTYVRWLLSDALRRGTARRAST